MIGLGRMEVVVLVLFGDVNGVSWASCRRPISCGFRDRFQPIPPVPRPSILLLPKRARFHFGIDDFI
jgi:hypothetical protein